MARPSGLGSRPLNQPRTITKNSGTMKMARRVAVNMPPITPVPMSFWLPAPAPVEMARGVTPAMKASEGHQDRAQAQARRFLGRVQRAHAGALGASANSTIRIAFLAERPMVVIRATWK